MLGVVGGTGVSGLDSAELIEALQIDTPFGATSAPIQVMNWQGQRVAFLARHGQPHAIAPHLINYRANIWALQQIGVTSIIAIAAVGGISVDTGSLVVPDNIIDYTYGRAHTFFAGESVNWPLRHIDFSYPYTESLRQCLILEAAKLARTVVSQGCYGATQGPRLESAAEINRLEKDGCSIVGMTGMPEAALARELDLAYACLALVVNPAAGKSQTIITMEDIQRVVASGMQDVMQIIGACAKIHNL